MSLPRFTAADLHSHALREAWEQDGVVVLEDFVSTNSIETLRRRASQLREDCARAAPHAVFDASEQAHGSDAWFRDSGEDIRAFFEPHVPPGLTPSERPRWVNKLGHALHDLDTVFDEALRHPDIAALVTRLGCSDPRLVQSMVIFKEAGLGDAVPSHQDATFLATDPPSVIGFWLALDRATPENGALEVARGAHRGHLRCRYRREHDELRMDQLSDAPVPGTWTTIEAEPGTLVAFHGLLPHRSGPNRSTEPRWAVTMHVVNGRAHWCDDNWLVRKTPFRGF